MRTNVEEIPQLNVRKVRRAGDRESREDLACRVGVRDPQSRRRRARRFREDAPSVFRALSCLESSALLHSAYLFRNTTTVLYSAPSLNSTCLSYLNTISQASTTLKFPAILNSLCGIQSSPVTRLARTYPVTPPRGHSLISFPESRAYTHN